MGSIKAWLSAVLLAVAVCMAGSDAHGQDVIKTLTGKQPDAGIDSKKEPAAPTSQGGATQAAATQGAATQASTQPGEANKGLSSPRATMQTFMEGMGQMEGRDAKASAAGWKRVQSTMDASQVVDLSTLRSKAEAMRGVLDRLGEPEGGDLPGDAEVEQTAMARFRYFPRQPEHAWVWKELKAFQKSPDGSITFARDGLGAWRFSAKTVSSIEVLYQSMKDLPPRYTMPGGKVVGMLGPTFAQTTWVGWGVLLGAIFAGLAVGRLAQAGLVVMSKFEGKRGHKARSAVLGNMAGPTSFAFLTAGLHFGMHLIYMEPDVQAFAGRMIQFLVLLAVGWLMYNLIDLIDLAIRQFTEKTANKLDDMVVPLIRKALRVFLVVVFTLFVAQNVFGLNITSWLAGLGIAGLAVSLAAQDSVKNLFGSIVIFFDRPFGVGDWIKFEGFDGTVEEIGFRSSRVRTLAGHLVTVPNMKFNDNSVENMSARPYIRRSMNVMIMFDMPPEKVEEAVSIIRKLLSEPPVSEAFDMEKWPAHAAFDNFNTDSLNIQVYYWYTLSEGRDYWTYLDHAEDFNLRLLKAFGAAGIKFSFPKQTPYVAPVVEGKGPEGTPGAVQGKV